MALTEEQVKEAKKQLLEQVQNLPEEQKKQAEEHISSMTPEAIELMIQQQQETQRIFRMIVEKKIPSTSIGENSEAIAVLSVKAISEGHAIIIPKNPAEDEKSVPKGAMDLSKEISEKIKANLKAKSVETIAEKSFGEVVLNVIPVYDTPLDLKSQRIDKTPEQLQEIKQKIALEVIKKPEKTVIKIEKKKPSENQVQKLKRRIP